MLIQCALENRATGLCASCWWKRCRRRAGTMRDFASGIRRVAVTSNARWHDDGSSRVCHVTLLDTEAERRLSGDCTCRGQLEGAPGPYRQAEMSSERSRTRPGSGVRIEASSPAADRRIDGWRRPCPAHAALSSRAWSSTPLSGKPPSAYAPPRNRRAFSARQQPSSLSMATRVSQGSNSGNLQVFFTFTSCLYQSA